MLVRKRFLLMRYCYSFLNQYSKISSQEKENCDENPVFTSPLFSRSDISHMGAKSEWGEEAGTFCIYGCYRNCGNYDLTGKQLCIISQRIMDF